MTFTDELWHSTQDLYEAMLVHPFNTELAAGSLSLDKFTYYVQQDEIYIKAYARALALLAAKAPLSSDANDLLSYAKDGVMTERYLHEHFFTKFSIAPVKQAKPACLSYSSFLLATAAVEPFAVGVAALLPCFWIYQKVGHFIAEHNIANNPYQAWIDTYTDAEYDTVVERMIEMTENAAQQASKSMQKQMRLVFINSTRFEYHFWDAAYHLQDWVK